MTAWTWADLEREAPDLAKMLELWSINNRSIYGDDLAAAIGRLLAQRDARIAELERRLDQQWHKAVTDD